MQITKCRRNNAKASLLQNRNANFKTTKYERKNKYEAQTPAKNLSRGADKGDNNDVKSSDNHIIPLKHNDEIKKNKRQTLKHNDEIKNNKRQNPEKQWRTFKTLTANPEK